MSELHVYTNEESHVIAASVADAQAVWFEHAQGNPYNEDDDGVFEQVPDGDEVSIWHTDDEDLPMLKGLERDEKGYTRTAADWVKVCGRSFLCTTEY